VTFEINALDELSSVAAYLADIAKQHPVITFDAPMGAGKTTLISKICEALQTDEHCSSPTYAIYNEYYSPSVGTIYHFDCYRLKSMEEALDAGIEEILDSGNICLIEWPEKIKKLLPEKCVEVVIKLNNHQRIITVTV
jgi:tRNA threonylcarbamoyladenosine biosynthesis protein TsaE